MKIILATVLLASNAVLANSAPMEVNFNLPPLLDLEQNLHTVSLNGRILTPDEDAWSHSVYLQIQSKEKPIGACSGTIIATDTILTAAHCFPKGADSVKIIFGLDVKNKKNDGVIISNQFLPHKGFQQEKVEHKTGNETRLTFDRWHHELFQNFFDSLTDLVVKNRHDEWFGEEIRNDIALVFFEGGLPKNSATAPFFSQGEIPKLKEKIYSYGYGIDTRDLDKREYFLREAKEMVFAYYVALDSKPKFLLAYSGSDSTSNVCYGDSGGGGYFENKATKRRELLAITNTSANGCADFSGHLFIYPFFPWIEKSVKEYRARKGI